MFKKIAASFSALSVFSALLLALFFAQLPQPAHAGINVDSLIITVLKEAIKGSADAKQETPAPPKTSERAGNNRVETSPYAYRGLVSAKITGTNVKLYDRPSARSRVVMNGIRVSDEGYGGYEYNNIFLEYSNFLAESAPIRDSADNSTWYKLVFAVGSRSGEIEQLDKFDDFGRTTPYINAKNLTILEFDDYQKETLDYYLEDLEWTKQGRPPRFNVGDSFAKVKSFLRYPETYRSARTKVRAKLYSKPDKNSQTFFLPRGTAIIDPVPWGDHMGRDMYAFDPPGLHRDMQDHFWYAIIDANSMKVIGWVDTSEHDFKIKNWSNPVPNALLPEPSEDDVGENGKKIFIY